MIECDVLIIGGGVTGLCIAHQLIESGITKSIVLIEKEEQLGMHTSGRNSGVLHAGIYYEPNSMKAKVCVKGARRLKAWIKEKGLPINECGKYIVAQDKELDSELDKLKSRGISNGAQVKLITKEELAERFPQANTASERALWSPQTCVVDPKRVIKALRKDVEEKGVQILVNSEYKNSAVKGNRTLESGNHQIHFKHAINCSGVHACQVAKEFGINHNYFVLPFKGEYLQLKKDCNIKIPSNLYPVPDLKVPFLGVHFTPNAYATNPIVSIGPTATLALGEENYKGINGIQPLKLTRSLLTLTHQYLSNTGGFRNYVHSQAFQGFQPIFITAAQKLIPDLKSTDVERSPKVGIRAQLYNFKASKLESDFVCINGEHSTHVLNAISPAFTSSFELADLIIERSNLRIKLA